MGRERRKTTEVPIVRPQLAHAVRQAQSGDAGIVDLRTCSLSCRQAFPEVLASMSRSLRA